MKNRLLFLNGLAILAVVINHAASWGYTAMFWWVDRYRHVPPPNFDQVGSLPYYGLLAAKQLTVFSVPAFLFVSGFFIAYAARGTQNMLNWRMIRRRVSNLLIPYFLWSIVIFIGDAIQGQTYPFTEYLVRLIQGQATSAYFYVPLLCQFYLLSPFVVRTVKARWQLALIGAAIVQIAVIALKYLLLFSDKISHATLIRHITSPWLFPGWIFFFVFGVVFSFHRERILPLVLPSKRKALALLAVLTLLVILEPEFIYRLTGRDWRGTPLAISGGLYALYFILCFATMGNVLAPFSNLFHQLGRKSFGIYLLHPKVLEFFARVIRQVAPWLLGHQILYQPILIILGVSVPSLFMTAVTKSSLRRFYHLLFG